MITRKNIDDRNPILDLALLKNIFGKLFGDKGYLSQNLFIDLYHKGIEIITKLKKSMKNKIINIIDKFLLRKRGIIESVHNKLKNCCQIEHHRHRSRFNFLVNLISRLAAYCHDPCKPNIYINKKKLF